MNDSEPSRFDRLKDAVEDDVDKFTHLSPVSAYITEARGRSKIDEPVLPNTGGPAGNARLTSIIGLLTLLALTGQILTLLDVRAAIMFHVGIGSALIAIVLAKVGSTGYKIIRYYTGDKPYVETGPPPTILRVLGPFLIAAALTALGTGLALVLMGEGKGEKQTLFTIFGQRISWVSVHSGAVWLFGVLVLVHVVGRFMPMLRRLRRPADQIPGRVARTIVIVAVITAAAAAASWGVNHVGGWYSG